MVRKACPARRTSRRGETGQTVWRPRPARHAVPRWPHRCLSRDHDGRHGQTVARSYGIDRRAQDAFALRSQIRASAADRAGQFATEIVPIEMGRPPSHATSTSARRRRLPSLAASRVRCGRHRHGRKRLRHERRRSRHRHRPRCAGCRARIGAARPYRGLGACRRRPEIMGIGPIPATHRLLERTGWGIGDIDLWEINEAFAAQALAVLETLKLDHARVNVNGAPLRLDIPSAPPERGSSSRLCTRCAAGTCDAA